MELIIPLIIMVGALWFMSRSQKKQQQQRQTQLNQMSVGDDIVTIGGLHGVLSEINTEKGTVTLDCEGIFLEFDRAAVKTIKPNTSLPTSNVDDAETTDEEHNDTPEA